MATLPTVQDLGPRNPVQGSTGVRRVANADAVGRALTGFGNAVFEEGNRIAEREATAAAKERDTYAADAVRDALYNPETGFMNQKGRNAVDLQKDMDDALLKIREESLKGLTKYAASKVDAQLQRRIDGAQEQVLRHTTQERETWINGASEARIISAQQDAIFNPAASAEAEKTIIGEMRDQGNREGWDPEYLRVQTEAKVSQMYVEQVENLASINPIDALGYLQANEDKMTESDRKDLLRVLRPDAKRYRGRQLGQEAANTPGSPIAYREAVSAVESRGSGDYLARGPVIEKGRYKGERAMGRYQVMPGNLPEWSMAAVGRVVTEEEFMADPDLQDQIFDHRFGKLVAQYGNPQDAASAWFTGGPLSANAERSDGYIKASEYVSRFNSALGQQGGGGGMEALLDIEDPMERSSAIAEYELISGVRAKDAAKASEAALNSAWGMIDNGGDLNDLSRAEKEMIGFNGVRALQQYQAGQVTTDQGYMTNLYEEYANDPQAFMAQNPADWLGHLDRPDYEQMVKLRAQMISGQRTAAVTPPTVSALMAQAAISLEPLDMKRGTEEYAQFQNEILQWATENPEAANNETARQQKINSMLIPVYLNPKGTTGNRQAQDVSAFQLNLDGEPLDPSDDLTVEDLYQSTIKIRDRTVPKRALEEIAKNYVTKRNRMPTADEMMSELLIAYGAN